MEGIAGGPADVDSVRDTVCRESRSFPQGGNELFQALDSSAFVPDAALPPASMQASLRWNDGKIVCRAFSKSQEQRCRDGERPVSAPAVIPATAGIHAYRDAGALINDGAARIFRGMI